MEIPPRGFVYNLLFNDGGADELIVQHEQRPLFGLVHSIHAHLHLSTNLGDNWTHHPMSLDETPLH